MASDLAFPPWFPGPAARALSYICTSCRRHGVSSLSNAGLRIFIRERGHQFFNLGRRKVFQQVASDPLHAA